MEKVKCIVCGMEINIRNWELNKEAMLNINSTFEIKSCPFCGAGEEYLKENIIIRDSKDILDENTIKILDHAMKLEVFNADFYKQASELSREDKNKKIFAALSRVETIHARIHQKLGGFKDLPILKKIDYSKYEGDKVLFEMASKREAHAVEYYSKYVKEVCCDRVKEVFKALSEVESEHIELTLREIK